MLNGFPIDKGSVIRIVVFLFAWLNQYLVANGNQPLPVLGEAEVAAILVFGASVVTLIKTNTIRKPKPDTE